MAVKVDLEKAYDRVSWSFLKEILRDVGFLEDLVKLMMFCIKSIELSILWNGKKLEPIKPRSGLRQGDPLSIYFFVLCMEVLGQRIESVVQ